MAVLALPAVLTMAEAREALAQLEAGVAADPAPAVDASALATLDTAALAVLLHLRRVATEAGKPLAVQGAPQKLADLAKLYGVDALLGL
jgi:phospholipid transport system transporter-binding protein